MANNSASVLVTLTVWWTIFVKGLLTIWMCAMEVAMLFLMLALDATMATDGNDEDSKTMSSMLWFKTQSVKSRNNSCIE